MGYNQPMKIIDAGSINFSLMVRQNQALSDSADVGRAIMGYTLIILMIANIWNTLMRVLGIGVSMYDEHEEERARLETQQSEVVNIDGETGQFTRTISMYDPKKRYRQNVTYKNK